MSISIDIQDLYCPITKHIFLNPVVASDGFTYENDAIREWFSKNDSSPVTGNILANKMCIPNNLLKCMIKGIIDTNKKLLLEQYRQTHTIKTIVQMIDNNTLDIDSINEIVGFSEMNPNIDEDDKIIEKFIKHADAKKLIKKMADSEFAIIVANAESEEQFRFIDYCITLSPSNSVMKYVIDRTPSIDMIYNDGTTILNLSMNWDSSVDVVEHILQTTTNFNIFSHQSYSWKVFKKLCELCCESDIISDSLIEIVAKYGDIYKTKKNIVFADGCKHIHYACMYGPPKLVDLLCNYGSDLESKTKDGKSCMALACINNNMYVIDYLIDKNVDVIGEFDDIKTILHNISELLSDNFDIYEKLIRHYVFQKENLALKSD